jgi:hypothetical protein
MSLPLTSLRSSSRARHRDSGPRRPHRRSGGRAVAILGGDVVGPGIGAPIGVVAVRAPGFATARSCSLLQELAGDGLEDGVARGGLRGGVVLLRAFTACSEVAEAVRPNPSIAARSTGSEHDEQAGPSSVGAALLARAQPPTPADADSAGPVTTGTANRIREAELTGPRHVERRSRRATIRCGKGTKRYKRLRPSCRSVSIDAQPDAQHAHAMATAATVSAQIRTHYR